MSNWLSTITDPLVRKVVSTGLSCAVIEGQATAYEAAYAGRLLSGEAPPTFEEMKEHYGGELADCEKYAERMVLPLSYGYSWEDSFDAAYFGYGNGYARPVPRPTWIDDEDDDDED